VTVPKLAAPLDWGTSDELSPLETLMWRADTDRAMRSTVMAVELLDREPDWNRLVDAHEWACRMVPRLRDRVSSPLVSLGHRSGSEIRIPICAITCVGVGSAGMAAGRNF
jgi:hypothetical protein